MRILILILVFLFSFSIFGQQKMTQSELDGLKGKVKSLTTTQKIIESKNYADNNLRTLLDEVEYYDESGVPTENIRNEYNRKTVYTFIDGNLTSKNFQITEKASNVVRFRVSTPKEEKQKDDRYDLKHKYKYDKQGQIIEQSMFSNDGDKWKRIVYKYDNQGILIEESHYIDEENRLNNSSFYTYDKDKNLLEEKVVLYRPNKDIITIYKYSDYKLDKQGNWIERTITSLGEFNGKELKKVSKYSRKIEYYK